MIFIQLVLVALEIRQQNETWSEVFEVFIKKSSMNSTEFGTNI